MCMDVLYWCLNREEFKGIVLAKIKILSSFIHPHIIQNLYLTLFCLWNTENCLSGFVYTVEVNGVNIVWFPTFFNFQSYRFGLE